MAQDATKSMAIWTVIGIAIGVALGAAMDNMGAGIAVGAGIGVALGLAVAEGQKKPTDNHATDDHDPKHAPATGGASARRDDSATG